MFTDAINIRILGNMHILKRNSKLGSWLRSRNVIVFLLANCLDGRYYVTFVRRRKVVQADKVARQGEDTQLVKVLSYFGFTPIPSKANFILPKNHSI